MMLAAISGIESTVAVTSRSAYSCLSAGHEIGGLADDRHADVAHLATNSSSVSSTRKPGIDSSLSSVPPVCPSPRPLIFPNGTPQAATIGATAIEVLSPTPPVECLSTTFRPSAPARSIVSPLRIIASVSASVSAARQAAEVDGHAERGQLVVGDLAVGRSRG